MTRTVARLVGVYDADGTVRGEVSYFLRAQVGRAHCALCDITHGRLRERADWKTRRAGLPVPFAAYHRDDQPPAVRRALHSVAPAVVAETTSGEVVELVDGPGLERCAGSPDALAELSRRPSAASACRGHHPTIRPPAFGNHEPHGP